ncbi:MAG: hypothetical protein K6F42_03495 [Bacteroidales bacterium]|nr:hypothetical protein [Bacteroidales bacterium]
MERKIKYLLSLAIFFLLAAGCGKVEKEPVNPVDPEIEKDVDYMAKTFLRREYMNVYYYWYQDVYNRNASLQPQKYGSIDDFFKALLYQGDRWSWMCDKDEYISTETGVYKGTWGVSWAQAAEDYGDFAIRVRFIYPGSPFTKHGITRGARLDAIGGRDISEPFTQDKLAIFNEEIEKVSTSFTFHRADGTDVTFTASRATELSTRSTLVTEVFGPDDFPGLGEEVGYIHYLAYKFTMVSDIKTAMQDFHDRGIHKLIVDLRYNGGGDVSAATELISWLAPIPAQGNTYVKMVHNDKLASLDKEVAIPENKDALRLTGLYFILGKGSASASEVTVNGLAPYMTDYLHTVGKQTYGKPNGMYVLFYPGTDADYQRYNNDDYSRLKYAFLPICFYNKNSVDVSIPDAGMVPDNWCPDDLYHDFGPQEENIKDCLTHIATGSFPVHEKAETKAASARPGLLLPTPESSDPHYGLFKALP